MHKKFEIKWTKIKGSCQSGRNVVTHNSKSDLPVVKNLGSKVQVMAFLLNVIYPRTLSLLITMAFILNLMKNISHLRAIIKSTLTGPTLRGHPTSTSPWNV